MKRWFSAGCLFVAAAGLLAADNKKEAADKDAAKVQVTRLEIRNAPPAKKGEMRFVSNGINMDLLVSAPGKHITGVDFKASKLESFTDDKKNNLHK
ncbi:MAG: hypothetical protein ACRELF_23450, partial [Gemmataceae bacterium]